MARIWKTFSDVLEDSHDMDKYNPYHDSLGRFTSANGARVTVPNGSQYKVRSGGKVSDAEGDKTDPWTYVPATYENALGQRYRDGSDTIISGPNISINGKDGKRSNDISTSGARHISRLGSKAQARSEQINSNELKTLTQDFNAKQIKDKNGNVTGLEIPVSNKFSLKVDVPSDMTRTHSDEELMDAIDAAFDKEIERLEWEQAEKLPTEDEYWNADNENYYENMQRDIDALDKERGYGINDLKNIRDTGFQSFM